MKNIFLLLIFMLVMAVHAMDSTFDEKKERTEFAQALLNFDFKEIIRLCNRGFIDLNSIDFHDVVSPFDEDSYVTIKVQKSIYQSNLSNLLPLEYAVLADNLDLVSLLCSYGADPNAIDCRFRNRAITYSRYRSLSLLFNAGLKLKKDGYDQNILHRGCYSCNYEDTQKFIAASILLYGKRLLNEKDSANKTPLEHARSNSFVRSAKEAVKILENEKLLDATMEEVASEFKGETVKKLGLGLNSYIKGKEIGTKLGDMREHQRFLKRKQQLIKLKEEK